MARIRLSRLPGDRVLVTDDDGAREIALGELPRLVREREVAAPR